MSAPGAITATFADIKTVRTRGVYQLVFEAPIEGMGEAIGLLGAPTPASEVWVAIARLNPQALRQQGPAAIEPPGRRGSLAQMAGILCNEVPFRRWLAETGDYEGIAVLDLDMAADAVREKCGIASRADLDRDEAAAQRFRDMKADYKLWRDGVTI